MRCSKCGGQIRLSYDGSAWLHEETTNVGQRIHVARPEKVERRYWVFKTVAGRELADDYWTSLKTAREEFARLEAAGLQPRIKVREV